MPICPGQAQLGRDDWEMQWGVRCAHPFSKEKSSTSASFPSCSWLHGLAACLGSALGLIRASTAHCAHEMLESSPLGWQRGLAQWRAHQPRAVQGGVGASARVRMTLPWPWGGLSCPSRVFLSVQGLGLAHLQALASFKLIVWRERVNEWLSHDPCHKFLVSVFQAAETFLSKRLVVKILPVV